VKFDGVWQLNEAGLPEAAEQSDNDAAIRKHA